MSLVDASFGGLTWRDACAYIPAQIAGCISARSPPTRCSASAPISISTTSPRDPGAPALRGHRDPRADARDLLARADHRAAIAPAAVGAYIGAAYFFTSSTSFANPAISIGRMFSNTFAGIAPASVPGYVIAQLIGGGVAVGVIRVLYPDVTPGRGS